MTPEPFVLAALVVGIAELGDKTQLLALVLANRFRRPVAVASGMICALISMHALAAFGGAWLDRVTPDRLMNWVVGAGFLLMAVWMALSRGHSREEVREYTGSRSAFFTALTVFVMLEFGDKSQLATVGLAITLEPVWTVAAGAALGSILVNLPVIWLGWKLERRIPHQLCHWAAAVILAVTGTWILLHQALGMFG